MDNNIVKENFLEIIPSREIAITDVNNDLQIKEFNKELLPVIVKPLKLTLPILERDFSNINKKRRFRRKILKLLQTVHTGLENIGIVLGKIAGLFVNFIRWCLLTSAKFVCFVAMSAIVIISTTILTQNIINAQMGKIAREDRTKFSVFQLKDDIKLQ